MMRPISNIEMARAKAAADARAMGDEGKAHDIEAGLLDDCDQVQRHLLHIENGKDGAPSIPLMLAATLVGGLSAFGVFSLLALFGVFS